ncbi:MAG: zinc ribbon domain-containing protein [Nitrospirota bacterium]
MPIFEYKCQNCGEDFEKLVSGSNPEISCPKCSSKNIKKKFSVFGMSGVQKQVSSGSGCTSCSSSSCSTCH